MVYLERIIFHPPIFRADCEHPRVIATKKGITTHMSVITSDEGHRAQLKCEELIISSINHTTQLKFKRLLTPAEILTIRAIYQSNSSYHISEFSLKALGRIYFTNSKEQHPEESRVHSGYY